MVKGKQIALTACALLKKGEVKSKKTYKHNNYKGFNIMFKLLPTYIFILKQLVKYSLISVTQISLVVFIFFITPAYANEFSKDWSKMTCPELQTTIAHEFVALWLRGPNLTKQHNCLRDLKLKYIEVEHVPSNETDIVEETLIFKPYKVTIKNLTEKDFSNFSFDFVIDDGKNIISDTMTYHYIPLRSTFKFRRGPCAVMQVEPEKNIILKSCK